MDFTDEEEDDGFIAEDKSEGTTQQGSEDSNEEQVRRLPLPFAPGAALFSTGSLGRWADFCGGADGRVSRTCGSPPCSSHVVLSTALRPQF